MQFILKINEAVITVLKKGIEIKEHYFQNSSHYMLIDQEGRIMHVLLNSNDAMRNVYLLYCNTWEQYATLLILIAVLHGTHCTTVNSL